MLSVEQQIQKISNNVVPKHAWLWLFTLFIIIIALFFWAIFGSLDLSIQGKGIVLNSKGLFNITSSIDGTIKKLYVKPGETIHKGTLLAEIFNADQEQLLESTQIQIKALMQTIEKLKDQIEVEFQASKAALERQLSSLEVTVKLLNEQLAFLRPEYQKKKELYDLGLITIGVVQEANRQIQTILVSLKEKESEILDVQAKLIISYRTEELKNKQLELIRAQQEELVIIAKLKQSKIFSLYDGQILELLVSLGTVVKEGQAIINGEFDNPQREWVIYGYFPSEFGKYIQQGDVMKLYLSEVNKKEYGALLSQVDTVSSYPTSAKFLTVQFNNSNLVKFLTNQKPATQVISIPWKYPHDPSGYRWTSNKGPNHALSSGQVGDVEVVVESVHPIYYLFPKKEFKEYKKKSNLPN